MGKYEGNIGKALKEVGKLTLDQLDCWGVQYDEIYCLQLLLELIQSELLQQCAPFDQLLPPRRTALKSFAVVSLSSLRISRGEGNMPRKICGLDGKPAAPLEHPALQNVTTAACAHAGPESVNAASAPLFGLVSPLRHL